MMPFIQMFLILAGIFISGSIGADKTVDLVVLHVNDTHGRLAPYEVNGKSVGGIGRLSTLVKQIRKEHSDRVLLLHAGDMFSRGNPAVIYTGGQVNVLAFQKMGFDVITPGNGEFYFGIENLQRQIARVSTPFVHANVTYKQHNGPILRPYVIKEIQGVTVGVLGLGLIRPWHQSSQHLILNDPIETAQKYVAELRPKVDFLIALTHIGAKNDSLLAAAVSELDLIVGGDSHTRFDKPSRIVRINGEGSVPMVQARHYYQFLGRVDVQLKQKGTKYQVTQVDGQLLAIDDQIETDPEMDALIAEYAKPLEEVICRTERELSNARDERSALGDLVGKAVLQQTGADVAILERNGRGHGVAVGDIRLRDIYRIRQYRAPVMFTRLTLEQIKTVLVRNYQTAGCSFERTGKVVRNFKVDGTPDSRGTYLVAMERQVAFRHFLRNPDSPVRFDFTGQRVDTALERYLRDVKVLR